MAYIGKTPASAALTSGDISDGIITTSKIADDAATADKIANAVNTSIAANTAKTTNATHSGEVTGSGALTIADNVVDEANLKVSNSPTNGYFLAAQSGNTGGLTWQEASGGTNTPNFEVKKGSGGDQTISNNSWTKVTFQSEAFDSDSAMDLGNDKFTVPSNEGGKYFFYCSILWNGDDRGVRKIALRKNGSTVKVLSTTHTNSYDGAAISAGALLDLSASDYIEVYCYQSSGDPETLEADDNAGYFGGFKLI